MLKGKIRDIATRVNTAFHTSISSLSGFDPFIEEWDILILLDAARPDMLAQVTSRTESVQTRRSPGANSWEYMEAVFVGREIHDTVYVSANPFTPRIPEGTFHAVQSLLETDWDEDLQTVPPASVADVAREAAAQFPHKRLIVHFMQPHTPFISEMGRSLGAEEDFRGVLDSHNPNPGTRTIWWQLRYGTADFSLEKVVQAYRENLHLAVEHAEPLIDELTGSVVVSADHGEMLGGRQSPIPVKGFGHEYGLHVPELIEVPWLEVPGNSRMAVADPPVSTEQISGEVMEERLEALGYTQ